MGSRVAAALSASSHRPRLIDIFFCCSCYYGVVLLVFGLVSHLLARIVSDGLTAALTRSHPISSTAPDITRNITPKYLHRFHNYDPLSARAITVTADRREYFQELGGLRCLREGTSRSRVRAENRSESRCLCKPGWYGSWCSFPDDLHYSDLPHPGNLTPRDRPRRIIYGSPFNIEFEMLEARLYEVGDIVDVFLVVESNYTSFGEGKPLRLLAALRDGAFHEWQDKIVYVYVPTFPAGGRQHGWIADTFYKNVVGTEGMKQVKGVEDADLFIFGDQDELLKREVVLFLKLHSGYPEPIRFTMRTTVFGFFLEGKGIEATMVCTVGMLARVFQYKSILLRGWSGQKYSMKLLSEYMKTGTNVGLWKFGKRDKFTGWHCSWCTNIEGVLIKLASAPNSDFPRWGSFLEKCTPDYIKSLIHRARWFNEKSSLVRRSTLDCPRYMLGTKAKFPYLFSDVYTTKNDTFHPTPRNTSQ